jgi:4-aminobutyrate--pyruvate transaminase
MSLFEHAKEMGEIFQLRLKEFVGQPLVGEVRGAGLIAAVELVKQSQPRVAFDSAQGVGAYCSNACQEAGVILRNLGDAVAFCPPLIISESQVHEMVDKFAIGLNKTQAWAKHSGLI